MHIRKPDPVSAVSVKQLRVCHFTYSFFPLVGGMEEVIHNLSISMLSQGCEPYVFAPHVRGRDNKLDVPYKVLRYQRPSSKRFGLRQLLIPLLWHHWKYRFDVLHCHGVYPPGYVGASFHKITGVPIVITPHGGDMEANDKGLIINSKITSRIRKTFLEANAVTAISSGIRNQVINLNAEPDKIFMIPNGIWLSEFKPLLKREERVDNDPYILYLGRLVQRKGVDALIYAFSKVVSQYPKLRLKIAGDGKEKNNLIKLTNELDIRQKVDFLGMVRGDEKVRLLTNAVFQVLFSRWEGLPVVVLEAFASGIPVIASRVAGTSDIIKDGENGFLVTYGDIEELVDKCLLLMRNEALRIRLASSALDAGLYYDWNKITEQYIALYRSLKKF